MKVRATYRFARVPEWVLEHPELRDLDVRVFGLLDRYGERVWPSLDTLGEAIGKDGRTICRSVARLVKVGAIVSIPRYVDGRRTTNEYVLAGDGPIADTPKKGGRHDKNVVYVHDKNVVAEEESHRNEKRTTDVVLAEGSSTRPQHPLYVALIAACGMRHEAMTADERRAAGIATGKLHKIGVTAEQLAHAPRLWTGTFPTATMTPSAIARHWGRMNAAPNGSSVKLSAGAQALNRAASRRAADTNQQRTLTQ